MIQAWTGFSIETQTWIALSIGWCMLVVSATIREKTPPGECRNWARAMGVVAVGLMSLQTLRVTMLVQELNTELMVRRGSHDVEEAKAVATEIDAPAFVSAVSSEYTAVNKAGAEISVTKLSSGQLGSVSLVRGRSGRDSGGHLRLTDGTGNTGAIVGGSDGRTRSLPNRESGVNF